MTLVTMSPEAACSGLAPDGFETLEHDRERACIADHGRKHADGYRLDERSPIVAESSAYGRDSRGRGLELLSGSRSSFRQPPQIERRVGRFFRRHRLRRADDALGGGVVAGFVDRLDHGELAVAKAEGREGARRRIAAHDPCVTPCARPAIISFRSP